MGPGQGQPSGAHLFCITLQIMQKKGNEGKKLNRKEIPTIVSFEKERVVVQDITRSKVVNVFSQFHLTFSVNDNGMSRGKKKK